MGFFSGLKKNLNHGGVKVQMQAPASISMASGSVPVAVTVSASDSPETINKVSVHLVKVAAVSPQGQVTNQTDTTSSTVSTADSTEVFNLNPGESKVVNLNLVMNIGKAVEQALPQGGALGSLAKGLGALQEIADTSSSARYEYRIQASADVAGVTIDPSTSQPVQVLRPGELGGAFNLKL